MKSAVQTLFWNPIVEKELRSRMRSWRAPVTITAFLTVVAFVGYTALTAAATSNGFGGTNPASAGIDVFTALTYGVLVLIFFVTPALTASAISGERDRQTLDLLLITRVRPAALVVGKLVASLLFVLLLILLSVPVFSFVFFFGGVALDQLVGEVVVGLTTALVLGAIGLLASALSRGSIAATVSSYVATFVFLMLPLMAPGIGQALAGPDYRYQPGIPGYQLFDPLVAASYPIGNGFSQNGGCSTNPITGSTVCQGFRSSIGTSVGVNVGISGGRAVLPPVNGGAISRGSGVLQPAPIAVPIGRPPLQPGQYTYHASPDRVVVANDKIIGGPLRGLQVWQAFVIADTLLAAIILAAAALALSRPSLLRRRSGRG